MLAWFTSSLAVLWFVRLACSYSLHHNMIVAFNKSSNKQKTTTHSTDEFYLCCIVTANGHPLYLHLYFITMLNGLGQEYEKTLAKHRVAKTCSHTSEKNINSELFPLNESQRFQLCSPAIRKKKPEAWTTHIVCQVIRFLLCF